MMKNTVVKLLDFEVITPFKREDIIKIFDTLPKYVIEKSKNENIPVEQAMKAINSEIQTVLEMLNEGDVELFFDIANEYDSLKMDESNDPELEKMQPEKDKWGFYIRFQISRPLGIDSNSLVFLDKFIIESDSELSLKEAKTLRLRNLENLIYREIAQVSRRAEQVLILAFAELGIGIAYPDNLASAAFLEKIKRESEKDFINRHTKNYGDYYEVPLIHLSDKFGVNLFLEKSTPWDTKAAQRTDAVDIEKFDDFFNQHYSRFEDVFVAGESFKKIKTANHILTTSLFDDSLINKIILSMTSIEVLSSKVRRPDAEIKALDYLSKKLNESDINDEVKKSIEKGLQSLQIQSIGKNCKTLVKNLLGKKDAELFYRLYDFRSQLVHTGSLKEEEEEEEEKKEMLNIYMDAYSLAKRLLVAYIDKSSKNPY